MHNRLNLRFSKAPEMSKSKAQAQAQAHGQKRSTNWKTQKTQAPENVLETPVRLRPSTSQATRLTVAGSDSPASF